VPMLQVIDGHGRAPAARLTSEIVEVTASGLRIRETLQTKEVGELQDQ
jgi:hypothetical protein